jgi:hypothetical protein
MDLRRESVSLPYAHTSVFSVFFPMSKFRLPTIFLARNYGFYGFLKNET